MSDSPVPTTASSGLDSSPALPTKADTNTSLAHCPHDVPVILEPTLPDLITPPAPEAVVPPVNAAGVPVGEVPVTPSVCARDNTASLACAPTANGIDVHDAEGSAPTANAVCPPPALGHGPAKETTTSIANGAPGLAQTKPSAYSLPTLPPGGIAGVSVYKNPGVAAVPAGGAPPVKEGSIKEDQRGYEICGFTGNNDLVVDVKSMRQAVRIFNCRECTVKINGKSAQVEVDRCNRVRFEFDTIIANFEVLNSTQLDIRPRPGHRLPSIRIEKSESIVVYLNIESMSCKVIHHISYPIVLMVPEQKDLDDELTFVPMTISTMFETVLVGDKLVTKPSTYC